MTNLLHVYGNCMLQPAGLLYALGNALACCNFSDSALIVLFGVS